MKSQGNRKRLSKLRVGLIQLEILIAAMLLGAVLSCMAGMNYRLLGVAKQTKHYQIALHEAANQIQILSSDGLDRLDDRIADAKLSPDILESLPGGTIHVQKINDKSGTKIIVRIGWDQLNQPANVELTGWVSTEELRP